MKNKAVVSNVQGQIQATDVATIKSKLPLHLPTQVAEHSLESDVTQYIYAVFKERVYKMSQNLKWAVIDDMA